MNRRLHMTVFFVLIMVAITSPVWTTPLSVGMKTWCMKWTDEFNANCNAAFSSFLIVSAAIVLPMFYGVFIVPWSKK